MKYIKVTNNTKRIKPLRILSEEMDSKVLNPGKSATGKYKESLKGYYKLLTKMGFTVEIVDDGSISEIDNKNQNGTPESTRIVEKEEAVVENTIAENVNSVDEVTSEELQETVEETQEVIESVSEEVKEESVVEETTEEANASSASKKRRGKKSSESNEENGDING